MVVLVLKEVDITLSFNDISGYSSRWSHGKTLSLAKAFLKYLTKMRLDTRYIAFELFLEMPKLIKKRMAVTSRIITPASHTSTHHSQCNS